MSVKWKNFKVVFRKSEAIGEPVTDVQLPMVFHLIGDPGERFNLWEVSMDMGWVMRPVLEQIAQFQQSVAKYPNISDRSRLQGLRINRRERTPARKNPVRHCFRVLTDGR